MDGGKEKRKKERKERKMELIKEGGKRETDRQTDRQIESDLGLGADCDSSVLSDCYDALWGFWD